MSFLVGRRFRQSQRPTHSTNALIHPREGGGPSTCTVSCLTPSTAGTPRSFCSILMSVQILSPGHRHSRGHSAFFLPVPFHRSPGSILSQWVMACTHLRSQMRRERRVHSVEVSVAYRPCWMRRTAFQDPLSLLLRARLHSLAGSSNGSIEFSTFSRCWSVVPPTP